MRPVIQRHLVILFVLCTYAWTWAVQVPPALAAHGIGHVGRSGGALTLAGFSPSLVALALVTLGGGRAALAGMLARIRDVRVPLRWYVFAVLFPLVTIAASLLALPITGQSFPALDAWYTPFGMFLLLIPLTGLLEEVGWRGLMLHRLQERISPFSATIIVGLAWGIWHVPTYLRTMPEGERTPLLLVSFLVGVLPLSVIFTWLYNRTGQRLLPVIVFHASIDASTSYLLGPVPSGNLVPFWPSWLMADVICAPACPDWVRRSHCATLVGNDLNAAGISRVPLVPSW